MTQRIDFDLPHDRDLARYMRETSPNAKCDFCGDETFSDEDHQIEHLLICDACRDEKFCTCCGGYRHTELSNEATCFHKDDDACEAALELEEAAFNGEAN